MNFRFLNTKGFSMLTPERKEIMSLLKKCYNKNTNKDAEEKNQFIWENPRTANWKQIGSKLLSHPN